MSHISTTSRYLPEKDIDNSQLDQFPPSYRDLIEQKAGVRRRRHVTSDCTSDIGAKAINIMLNKMSIDPLSIGALICATSSPDRIQPPTASRIQHLCGLKNAFAFDINAVCCGSIFGINMASALIKSGLDKVIIVASEVYSKILNPHDITTYPYFGDGAAAALISTVGDVHIVDCILYSDGSGSELIQVPAGGTMLPVSKTQKKKDLFFNMDGKKVFEFACSKGVEVISELQERSGVLPDRIVMHQANVNIVNEIAKRTKIRRDKFFTNMDRYGNTGGASVLIALDECLETYSSDQQIFLVAFGGGLSWGGVYLNRAKS